MVTVDPELRKLIPPLTDDERQQLHQNIIAEGCRDALVVWKEKQALLDGHNRLDICESEGIDYSVTELSFPTRDDARRWVIENQFGRRNLTPFQRAELALLLEPVVSKKAKENIRKGGGSGPSGRQNSDNPVDTKKEIAKVAGVSHDTIAKVKVIQQKAEPEVLEKVRSGDTSIHDAYTGIKRREKEEARESRRDTNRQSVRKVDESSPLDSLGARFATIVADPPWDWGDEGDVDQLGRAKPTYDTMPYERLLSLPVPSVADDDCHIYLWITNRSLPKGFALLEKWGFRYITCLTWCKPSFGMGNYFRGSTEQVLFGVKGSQPLKRKDAGTHFTAPRGPQGHSSKPVEFYEFVESCSPGPYLELFARSSRDDWTPWGADA